MSVAGRIGGGHGCDWRRSSLDLGAPLSRSTRPLESAVTSIRQIFGKLGDQILSHPINRRTLI
ncbi:hypothetical protein CO662_35975 [Rhizobium anhuiense]|jgi:hypothetical protein|uniref:Uncharacterized protein n=10 Tax=Rhizobium TaxID=379 RepID=A0A2A6J6E8_9HYPH|nr:MULTISPECIES: hypothetical protein [Rhizobium]ACE93938.1 hypothetical protein RHECIAT_PB0000228 [Rhizobium etli CIAT 652]AJC82370.1 hypothetical protein IE4803_PB00317 [Rhizobium etli bv. phaseoli str. IE4803]ANL24572.1 hypothetical protein AMJ96_PB00257 [Rhizobium sp. N113]ANL37298.1 hypothetical protein AMC89_PC00217 [Rhizobium phaseoli]ARM15054.1 hypothetical protein Bra5_PB00308 [Rhizobium phaseoli Brasil 5]ARM91314.1 hypothetical protein RHEC894_PC00282 [Rhizobium sp. CIAT894]ARO2688